MICTRRGVAAKHGLFLVPSQSRGSCMSSRSQTWMATCFACSTTFRGRPAEYELREVPENYSYWVLLVVVTDDMDLARLATHARRLQGTAQHVNCGADVFLADGKVRTSGAPAIGRIADRAF